MVSGMTDEISPLDGPPADGLEAAFTLPEYIAEDETLQGLYTEIVTRMRHEALGLPMNTGQNLLIERIASFYVQIRYRENNGLFTPTQQKDFNTYWLALHSEFNKQLNASADKMREAMLEDINQVVINAVDQIKDDETRRTVRRALAEGFAQLEV